MSFLCRIAGKASNRSSQATSIVSMCGSFALFRTCIGRRDLSRLGALGRLFHVLSIDGCNVPEDALDTECISDDKKQIPFGPGRRVIEVELGRQDSASPRRRQRLVQ